MAADQNDSQDMKPFGLRRRRFLSHTALIAAAGSAGAMLPNLASAAEGDGSKRSEGCDSVAAPMKDVAGKVAFITGGASGIGFGIAQAFVGAGMKVVLAGLSEARSKEALAHFAAANQASRMHAIRVDVTDRAALEKAAEETVKVFGKVHVLVNNAGISHPGKLADTTYDDWDWMMGVNLDGVFNGIRAFLPRIHAHGEGGHVISTSSVMGLYALNTMGAYTASKYAVVGLMEGLRAELAGTNVGVSVYCPGPVIPNTMSSSLHRPKDLSDGALKTDAAAISKEQKARQDPKAQANVIAAGRAVLRGLRNNDLYILTHPEYTPVLSERSAALLAASPKEFVTDEQKAQASAIATNSIYPLARSKPSCG